MTIKTTKLRKPFLVHRAEAYRLKGKNLDACDAHCLMVGAHLRLLYDCVQWRLYAIRDHHAVCHESQRAKDDMAQHCGVNGMLLLIRIAYIMRKGARNNFFLFEQKLPLWLWIWFSLPFAFPFHSFL